MNPSSPKPSFKPPTMGNSVNQVLEEFKSITLEHNGLAIVEAVSLFTGEMGQTDFRWMNDGLHVVVSQLGIKPGMAVSTRKATDTEYGGLEHALATGCVQITMFHRVTRQQTVLHQATGNRLPMDLPESEQPRRDTNAELRAQGRPS